jgi:16S rRNA (cytidine1402-2'-O)-methyltransferase
VSIIPGSLYVVATPIGNIEDLSARAIKVLGSVDIILAEDTRHSGYLLHKLGISTPMLAHHDHNENKQVAGIIKRLSNGETVALISDAGTPLISDPGYSLVIAAHEEGISVIPVPGPSALISALSVAGLETDRFVFEGYLPAKKIARQKYMQALSNETRTLVFYEVPHRIMQSLDDLIDCFGSGRVAALVKELTKVHETVYRATLSDLKSWLEEDKSRQKGEFVLLIQGVTEAAFDEQVASRILKVLLQSVTVKEATSIATEILGGNRNELYQLALQLKDKV